MADCYRPNQDKRRRSDSSPNAGSRKVSRTDPPPGYMSFKSIPFKSMDRPRSTSRGFGREEMSRDRTGSPTGRTMTFGTETTVDELIRKLIQEFGKTSVANTRHDLASQRAKVAQREHDNMEDKFAAFPAIAEQKRNRLQLAEKEVYETGSTRKTVESTLSSALITMIGAIIDQNKPAASTSTEQNDINNYEALLADRVEASRKCEKLEEQMRALQQSVEKQMLALQGSVDKQHQSQQSIFQDLDSIKKEASVARENRTRIERLQGDLQKQNASLEKHQMKLDGYATDITTLKSDVQKHAFEQKTSKISFEGKLRIFENDLSGHSSFKSKTNTSLDDVLERLDTLDSKNAKMILNVNNEFSKQNKILEQQSKNTPTAIQELSKRLEGFESKAVTNFAYCKENFEALESTIVTKCNAPTLLLPGLAMQREIDAIKAAIRRLENDKSNNSEDELAITAFGQRIAAIENDALPRIQTLDERFSTFERDSPRKHYIASMQNEIHELKLKARRQEASKDGSYVTTTALETRLLAIERQASSKTHNSTPQGELQAIKTTIQELKMQPSGNATFEQRLSTLENDALPNIQTLGDRLLALETTVIPEIKGQFVTLDEEAREKEGILDELVKEELGELEGKMEEKHNGLELSMQRLREEILPLHKAMEELQERPQEALAPAVQSTVAHPPPPPPPPPPHPVIRNGVQSPQLHDTTPSPNSLDQQKQLEAIGYAVHDLERRFNSIQTDEVASMMLNQMKSLYPGGELSGMRDRVAKLEKNMNNTRNWTTELEKTWVQQVKVLSSRWATVGPEELKEGHNGLKTEVERAVESISRLDADFISRSGEQDVRIGFIQAEIDNVADALGLGRPVWEATE